MMLLWGGIVCPKNMFFVDKDLFVLLLLVARDCPDSPRSSFNIDKGIRMVSQRIFWPQASLQRGIVNMTGKSTMCLQQTKTLNRLMGMAMKTTTGQCRQRWQ